METITPLWTVVEERFKVSINACKGVSNILLVLVVDENHVILKR